MPKACIVFMMLAMHQLDSDHLPGLYIPCKIDLGHAPPGQAMEDEIMADCYCFQFQHDLALPGYLSKVYTLLSWNLCQENTASLPIWWDYLCGQGLFQKSLPVAAHNMADLLLFIAQAA